MLGLLFFGSFLFLPTWLSEFLYRVNAYRDYTVGQSPVWLLTHQAVPVLGVVGEWVIVLLLLAGMLWAWWKTLRSGGEFHFYWALSITLIVSNLIVSRSATTNYVMLLLPTLWVLAALDRRGIAGRKPWGRWLVLLFLMASFVGLWALHFATVQGNQEQAILYIPTPVLLGFVFLVCRAWLEFDAAPGEPGFMKSEGKPARLWSGLGALLFLIWVAGVIALYFAIQKPFEVARAVALAVALTNLVAAGAMTCLAGGLGRRVSSKLEDLSPFERLALQAALGWGLIGLAVLAVGLLGGLNPWVAWLVLAAGLLWLRRQITGWVSDLRLGLQQARPASRLEWVALAFVLFTLLLTFIQALAPPTKWDSLSYHLELPRQYLTQGRVFYFPENLHGGFPQTVEMLYTWAMALSSPAAEVLGRAAPNPASLLSWMAGALALLGVEGFARRVTEHGAGWLAPSVLLVGASFAQALHWAYVDVWLALFGLALLVALEAYWRSGERQYLIWAGLAAGFALGSKTTAGSYILVGAVLLLPLWSTTDPLSRTPDQNRRAGFARRELVFLLCAFLAGSPWFLKNWLMAGNPLYPYFSFDAPLDFWKQSFGGYFSVWTNLLE